MTTAPHAMIYEPTPLTVAQVSARKAWERADGEPARWFMRFRNYLALGRKRSINAVYEAEKQEKASKSRGKAGETWYNAARRYQWVQRADAWDNEQDERKALLMRQIAMKCAFVSPAFRLTQLNALAETLMREVEKGQPAALFLAMARQMQAVMHDIADEVAAWGVPLDASCDAAALGALERKHERMAELQQAREEQEDYEMDLAIQKLALKRPDLYGPEALARFQKEQGILPE